MQQCFVIQPFDRGDFDRRYREIYGPAIKASGFEPYRVDEDAGASIPIDEIIKRIRDSAVCFADITIDNPNVWFEVGLAIAFGKDICLVCSSERKSFPFDVQHRLIIRYDLASRSDFDILEQKITERLYKIAEQHEALVEIPQEIVKRNDGPDFSDFEVAAIAVLMSADTDNVALSLFEYRRIMQNQGYSSGGANLAMRALIRKNLAYTQDVWEEDRKYIEIALTEDGWDWAVKNVSRFLLTVSENYGAKGSRPKPATVRGTVIDANDEIPF